MVQLIRADSPEWLGKVRNLFQQYARSLDFDLSFQGFSEEMKNLPGEYSARTGCLFLAFQGHSLAGCVALRKIGEGLSEMKRLFVVPEHRGEGVGRLLAEAVITEARKLGYERMRLDTVPSMASAIGLYRSLGFTEIDPYCFNPVSGAKYFELEL